MRDFSGINSAELIQQLAREKPECPVCHKPCDPTEGTIDIIMVPIPGQAFDTMGLLPVHLETCKAEAVDKLQAAQVTTEYDKGMAELEEYLESNG